MPINVLVVDDSAVMRAMIATTLRNSGLAIGEVFAAANGQEGVDLLGRSPVDLALVDLNMPVMDGEQFIAWVRQHAKPEINGLPMLVISPAGSAERLSRLIEQVDGFLPKPFTADELREVVGVLVEQPLTTLTPSVLTRVTRDVLATQCLVHARSGLEASTASDPVVISVSRHFSGPFRGRLELALTGSVLPLLAAGMLGAAAPPDPGAQVDALSEVASIICGNALPRLASGSPFHIGPAELYQNGPPPAAAGESLVGEAHVSLDEGRIDIRLIVGGVVTRALTRH